MKILVVCHGNVARSQIAELVFNKHTKHEVKSAGMRTKDGKPMSKKMRDAARNMGYEVSKDLKEVPRSSMITEEMVIWADKVLFMDNANLTKLNQQFNKYKDKFEKLGRRFIPDPGYHSIVLVWRLVAQVIEDSILSKHK